MTNFNYIGWAIPACVSMHVPIGRRTDIRAHLRTPIRMNDMHMCMHGAILHKHGSLPFEICIYTHTYHTYMYIMIYMYIHTHVYALSFVLDGEFLSADAFIRPAPMGTRSSARFIYTYLTCRAAGAKVAREISHSGDDSSNFASRLVNS